VFLDYFDVLISKMIFKKNIILMHFRVKNTLKNNFNHTLKHDMIPQSGYGAADFAIFYR
jgi:hypothetical protein